MWSKPNGGTLEDFRAQVRQPSSGGQSDFIGGILKSWVLKCFYWAGREKLAV